VAVIASTPFVKLLHALGPGAVAERDRSLAVLLPRYGLSVEALTLDGARVPHLLTLELLQRSAWLVGTDAIVLRAMHAWSLGDQGIGDYLNATAATVGDMLRTIVAHVGLLHDGVRFTLEEDGRVTRLVCRTSPAIQSHPWFSESVLGKVVFELRRAVAGRPDLAPVGISFTHGAPRYEHEYDTAFGIPTAFGHDENALTLPSHVLDAPLVTADPVLHRILLQQASALLRAQPRAPSLVDRVRTIAGEELLRSGADQATVARRVGLSVATLRRRLESEHGTRYSEILDELRKEVASRELFASELTIDEISYQTGFSQTAAFYRAFRRWFGCTPAEFRRARVPPR
jgi:AraC-like DNA-binding protein